MNIYFIHYEYALDTRIDMPRLWPNYKWITLNAVEKNIYCTGRQAQAFPNVCGPTEWNGMWEADSDTDTGVCSQLRIPVNPKCMCTESPQRTPSYQMHNE